MKNKPSKFEAFSSAFNSNKRPISSTQNPNYSLSTLNPEFTPSETKSMSSTGISCLIQKSLETLLKKENFLKSADLTRISQKEKKLEFSKISNQIRMGNKSAEYKEIAFNTVQPSEYEKFKSTFQTNITNNKGHFLYTESPFTRDKQNKLIKKITKENMNWSTKDQYNNLLKKRINNNGKATIIKELKDKSMGIIAEALERKCAKEKNEDYKKEIERNMDEMIELNEVISQEK